MGGVGPPVRYTHCISTLYIVCAIYSIYTIYTTRNHLRHHRGEFIYILHHIHLLYIYIYIYTYPIYIYSMSSLYHIYVSNIYIYIFIFLPYTYYIYTYTLYLLTIYWLCEYCIHYIRCQNTQNHPGATKYMQTCLHAYPNLHTRSSYVLTHRGCGGTCHLVEDYVLRAGLESGWSLWNDYWRPRRNSLLLSSSKGWLIQWPQMMLLLHLHRWESLGVFCCTEQREIQ